MKSNGNYLFLFILTCMVDYPSFAMEKKMEQAASLPSMHEKMEKKIDHTIYSNFLKTVKFAGLFSATMMSTIFMHEFGHWASVKMLYNCNAIIYATPWSGWTFSYKGNQSRKDIILALITKKYEKLTVERIEIKGVKGAIHYAAGPFMGMAMAALIPVGNTFLHEYRKDQSLGDSIKRIINQSYFNENQSLAVLCSSILNFYINFGNLLPFEEGMDGEQILNCLKINKPLIRRGIVTTGVSSAVLGTLYPIYRYLKKEGAILKKKDLEAHERHEKNRSIAVKKVYYLEFEKYGKNCIEYLKEDDVYFKRRDLRENSQNLFLMNIELSKVINALDDFSNYNKVPEYRFGTNPGDCKKASEAYDRIENDSSQVIQIANKLRVDSKIIEKVYEHVFLSDLRYKPNEEKANSWSRLAEGSFVKSDLIWLKYELCKESLANDYYFPFEEAHTIASELVDWEKAASKEGIATCPFCEDRGRDRLFEKIQEGDVQPIKKEEL